MFISEPQGHPCRDILGQHIARNDVYPLEGFIVDHGCIPTCYLFVFTPTRFITGLPHSYRIPVTPCATCSCARLPLLSFPFPSPLSPTAPAPLSAPPPLPRHRLGAPPDTRAARRRCCRSRSRDRDRRSRSRSQSRDRRGRTRSYTRSNSRDRARWVPRAAQGTAGTALGAVVVPV